MLELRRIERKLHEDPEAAGTDKAEGSAFPGGGNFHVALTDEIGLMDGAPSSIILGPEDRGEP